MRMFSRRDRLPDKCSTKKEVKRNSTVGEVFSTINANLLNKDIKVTLEVKRYQVR